jgi:hypothetical protein
MKRALVIGPNIFNTDAFDLIIYTINGCLDFREFGHGKSVD